MRRLPFDPSAKKRTVSLTLNSDLYAKAKAQGINASQVAEIALAQALTSRLTKKVRAEINRMWRPTTPMSRNTVLRPTCCGTISPNATMQLEVSPTRRAFPYVVVLPADIAALARERIIAFVAGKT
jgi:post-segregation antitoxin (ccd killing protein)